MDIKGYKVCEEIMTAIKKEYQWSARQECTDILNFDERILNCRNDKNYTTAGY